MKARLAAICVAALFANTVSARAMLGAASPQLVQLKCAVEAHYAVIDFVKPADRGKRWPRKYSVEFEPAGITVRFPPIYYAPEWSDSTVIIEFLHSRPEAGILRIKSPDSFGMEHTRTLGTVDANCWEKVRKYIKKNVEKKGVAAHIKEE